MADSYEKENGERVVIAKYSEQIDEADTISIEAKLFSGVDSNLDIYCFVISNTYEVVIGRMYVAKLVSGGGSLSFYETLENAINSVHDDRQTFIYVLVSASQEAAGERLVMRNKAHVQQDVNITILSGYVKLLSVKHCH